jgi:hypothetical protein
MWLSMIHSGLSNPDLGTVGCTVEVYMAGSASAVGRYHLEARSEEAQCFQVVRLVSAASILLDYSMRTCRMFGHQLVASAVG